jgi:hypothetical protein
MASADHPDHTSSAGPIEQRGPALWPVVALVSAAHHRLRFASGVASVSVRGAGAPRKSTKSYIANASQLIVS